MARFSFLCKADVAELGGSDELCGKGAELTLFLFSDVLEISKRRRGRVGQGQQGGGLGLAAGRSPSTLSLRNPGLMAGPNAAVAPAAGRPHKHVDLLSLSSVRRVVDLADSEDSFNCFTLVVRNNQVWISMRKINQNCAIS